MQPWGEPLAKRCNIVIFCALDRCVASGSSDFFKKWNISLRWEQNSTHRLTTNLCAVQCFVFVLFCCRSHWSQVHCSECNCGELRRKSDRRRYTKEIICYSLRSQQHRVWNGNRFVWFDVKEIWSHCKAPVFTSKTTIQTLIVGLNSWWNKTEPKKKLRSIDEWRKNKI